MNSDQLSLTSRLKRRGVRTTPHELVIPLGTLPGAKAASALAICDRSPRSAFFDILGRPAAIRIHGEEKYISITAHASLRCYPHSRWPLFPRNPNTHGFGTCRIVNHVRAYYFKDETRSVKHSASVRRWGPCF